jgi:hypothetical protein
MDRPVHASSPGVSCYTVGKGLFGIGANEQVTLFMNVLRKRKRGCHRNHGMGAIHIEYLKEYKEGEGSEEESQLP